MKAIKDKSQKGQKIITKSNTIRTIDYAQENGFGKWFNCSGVWVWSEDVIYIN